MNGSHLMVGDSAQDVRAGQAAGFHTCGITSNIGDPRLLEQAQPDFTISSLSDLKRIIN
jgi:phosphoglycolate phosphatase-like HAD superfamily hydrolase